MTPIDASEHVRSALWTFCVPSFAPHWFWIALPMATLIVGAAIGGFVATRMAQRILRATIAKTRMRYDHLAEQTSAIVLRFDGARIDISSSIEVLTGYGVYDMRSRSMADMVHPDDLSHVREIFEALDCEAPRRDITYRLIHRNGAIVWVAATFGRLSIGDDDVETIVTIRDVTAQHEEALALRAATQAARDAQDAANLANRAKTDFLASMSHEVRTPLGAIIGFADLLMASTDLTATARRHVERIKGGGDSLLTVVNDILDFSQAESGTLRLDMHPFSLPLLVDECIALVEHSAVGKHLALHIELKDTFPPGVRGDAARLRQVLLNLLNNAIKFTAQGSVTLVIRYDRQGDGALILFEITDTGIGIAADDLPRLFQRFSQVDGTIHRIFGGTGLGLAISKMLVELMGGTMGVKSHKGAGSTFWFSVRLEATPLVLETRNTNEQPTSRPTLDILLVEDTRINQELVCAIIEAYGHRVDIVSNGTEAIMAVQDKAYDLVLMDVQMPYLDGLSATRMVRALPYACRFVPIVAMTANVLKDQIADIYAAGMDDMLSKPLDLEALRAILDRAANKAVRVTPMHGVLDETILAKLIGLLGHAKVNAMIETMTTSVSNRFTRGLDADSVTQLKAEAHASLAGPAMLGFTSFANACRRFIEAETPQELDVADRTLRAELTMLVTTAKAIVAADGNQLVA